MGHIDVCGLVTARFLAESELPLGTEELLTRGLFVKACPFCGSLAVTLAVFVPGMMFCVYCDGCDTGGPITPGPVGAVDAWNERMTEAVVIAPLQPARSHETVHRSVHRRNGKGQDST